MVNMKDGKPEHDGLTVKPEPRQVLREAPGYDTESAEVTALIERMELRRNSWPLGGISEIRNHYNAVLDRLRVLESKLLEADE